ncbi:squalene synthase HpnD [Planotetraspora thailandica]|uniref:Squalene synthase HpnD n=1 Tax=Planotetraspora thailandica TaxID=487172 RepID=A0A8J3V9W9_9ACTN|nr:squalene/phytoene synthase family protein [Planotetraspora thailandica]GII56819.1 squalene synthase HpnD [Planotetraspora thailandica]
MDTSDAYRQCEQIVRSRAQNFAYGILLLPPAKRRALSAVYAFARRIDDIGDTPGPVEERMVALSDERARLGAPPDGDPVLTALYDAAGRFPIPLDAFNELIDGCAADVSGTSYRRFDDLLSYCRHVAGSIGRLSLGVFGSADPAAPKTADALGVALQLTNILRDLYEDRLAGRVYLPAEDLDRFGCTLALDHAGRFTDPPERLANLVRFEADRALGWYADGMRLIPMLDRRSGACTAAMAGIYRRLLGRIAADPASALRKRLSLAPWIKAMVAARAVAGAGR